MHSARGAHVATGCHDTVAGGQEMGHPRGAQESDAGVALRITDYHQLLSSAFSSVTPNSSESAFPRAMHVLGMGECVLHKWQGTFGLFSQHKEVANNELQGTGDRRVCQSIYYRQFCIVQAQRQQDFVSLLANFQPAE